MVGGGGAAGSTAGAAGEKEAGSMEAGRAGDDGPTSADQESSADGGEADVSRDGAAGANDASGGSEASRPHNLVFRLIDPIPEHKLKPGEDPFGIAVDTSVVGLSLDQSVVVGLSEITRDHTADGGYSYGYEPFRWTESTGSVSLGLPPGAIVSDRRATRNFPMFMSADASVVVGWFGWGAPDEAVFRWTLASGMVSLGHVAETSRLTLRAMSSDGAVVAGTITDVDAAFHTEALEWTTRSGWVRLGKIPGHTDSEVVGVSSDGSLIVGWSGIPFRRTPVLWPQGADIRSLDKAPGFDSCEPLTMTPDGKVIAGVCTRGSTTRVFRWTESTGFEIVGIPSVSITYELGGISSDGAVLVGNYENSLSGELQPFRFTEAGGAQGLGVLPGYVKSSLARDVFAMSADGTVVTGKAGDSNGLGPAFRWTETAGMASLGLLPGHNDSHASSVSPDGSFITGRSGSAAPGTYPRVADAVVWDARGAIHSIPADLVAAGIDLRGYRPHDAWIAVNNGKVAYYGVAVGVDVDVNRRRGWVEWLP